MCGQRYFCNDPIIRRAYIHRSHLEAGIWGIGPQPSVVWMVSTEATKGNLPLGNPCADFMAAGLPREESVISSTLVRLAITGGSSFIEQEPYYTPVADLVPHSKKGLALFS